MKSALLSALLLLSGTLSYSVASAATNKLKNSAKFYSFQFKAPTSKVFAITKKAASKEQAYKLAAAECFSKLTGNKYPGEEKGLEIIDICANPKM